MKTTIEVQDDLLEWSKRLARQERTIPWPCVHEFISVVTHPRIFKTPTPVEQPWRRCSRWPIYPREGLHNSR